MDLEDEWESRAWVAFAAAVIGGMWAQADLGTFLDQTWAERAAQEADDMLMEYRERRPR
jgi:hypothetical protein